MTTWQFPGSAPIDAFINLSAGSVALTAEPVEVTTVSLVPSKHGKDNDRLISEVRVSLDDGRLEISGPKSLGLRRSSALDLTISMPAQSRCTVRTASADVSCMGNLAELDARTASGDVTAASVSGSTMVNTASGDVWLEEAASDVRVHTASGDLNLLRAGGAVTVNTASGDVKVGIADSSVSVRTASGDVRLDSVRAGDTEANTVSGDVSVAVAAGTGVYLDLSSMTGDIKSQLDEQPAGGDDVPLRVSCRTVTGDIRIVRAPARPAGRQQPPTPQSDGTDGTEGGPGANGHADAVSHADADSNPDASRADAS
ncbi:MAG: DUF4097 family beta strand repeat-containing protein [Streptosporangiaceae bacterium]|jgi:hypothetical protein|nr:hypothetical protein [Actinomycetota bacterium]